MTQPVHDHDPQHGRRLDNFLMTGPCKGVPKSLIYKWVRTGQIRINGRRCKPHQRLDAEDQVRLPPQALRSGKPSTPPDISDETAAQARARWQPRVVHNSRHLMVVNKPAGLAVHAGSGVRKGLVETLREAFVDDPMLSLAHRLDRGTSGLVMLAKTLRMRRWLQAAFEGREVAKTYQAVLVGTWSYPPEHTVNVPLRRVRDRFQHRMVADPAQGQPSSTVFRCLATSDGWSWVEARPLTGRMHQIRVHAQCLGLPLLGDTTYGDGDMNKRCAKLSPHLFLHALRLDLPPCPWLDTNTVFECPLDEERLACLDALKLTRV